jgi:hypothetical protein
VNRRKIFLAILALVSAALLAYLLRDVLGPIVLAAANFLYQGAAILYRLFSERVYWLALLLVLVILALRSLNLNLDSPQRFIRLDTGSGGRASVWTHWIEQRSQGNYFKWRLARQIAQLGLEILAYREALPVETVEKSLASGEIELPEEVKHVFGIGLDRRHFLRYPQAVSRLRLFRRQRTSLFDFETHKMVTFLEERLRS